MCFIAIIPARSGSKSVVDKNITQLSGHPLLAYTIAAAIISKKSLGTLLIIDINTF